MKIYVGAAIDSARHDPTEGYEKLSAFCTALYPKGIVYNPFGAFRNVVNFDEADYATAQFVESINMHALSLADLAVFLVEDTPSFGVPIEIAHRSRLQKPCLVLYNATKRPGIYLTTSISRNKFGVLIALDLYNYTSEQIKKVKTALQAMNLLGK
jgi:hypothetical protein